MKNKVLVLGLILTFAWPLGSSAAWSDDPAENTQLTDATGAQHSPVMVSDGNDGAYIAWVDDASGNSDIYMQRVNAIGEVEWAADGVAVAETANNETDPQLIANPDGGVYVAWQSDVDNGNIYIRRYASNGNPLWDAKTVAGGNQLQTIPRMTAGTPRGVVIVYNRQPVGGDAYTTELYAAKFSNGGKFRWRNKVAPPTGTLYPSLQPVMFDNQMLLYWSTARGVFFGQATSSGLAGGSYSTRTASPGSELNDPFLVCDGNDVSSPCSAFDLQSVVFSAVSHGTTRIRLRRLSANSTWPQAGYAVASTGNVQTHPKAVSYDDSRKSEIITWVDGASNQQNILAQRIFRKDRMWGSDGVVVSNAANDQHSQEMIQADDGGALVAWIDERSSANGDLYSQRIGLDGTMAWTANGVPVSTRGGVQTSLKIIPSGSGFIGVWADGTGDNRDIYVQMVNGDGTL